MDDVEGCQCGERVLGLVGTVVYSVRLSFSVVLFFFFFFNDTATTEIYTLSLHDALPIWGPQRAGAPKQRPAFAVHEVGAAEGRSPEAAPSLRSEEHTSELQSPVPISYAVFCLKKKKKNQTTSASGLSEIKPNSLYRSASISKVWFRY